MQADTSQVNASNIRATTVSKYGSIMNESQSSPCDYSCVSMCVFDRPICDVVVCSSKLLHRIIGLVCFGSGRSVSCKSLLRWSYDLLLNVLLHLCFAGLNLNPSLFIYIYLDNNVCMYLLFASHKYFISMKILPSSRCTSYIDDHYK